MNIFYLKNFHNALVLALKRLENPHNFKTKRYTKAKTKLRREYQKVNNLQKDILNQLRLGGLHPDEMSQELVNVIRYLLPSRNTNVDGDD